MSLNFLANSDPYFLIALYVTDFDFSSATSDASFPKPSDISPASFFVTGFTAAPNSSRPNPERAISPKLVLNNLLNP